MIDYADFVSVMRGLYYDNLSPRGKYRDSLPSTEEFMAEKREEAKLEDRKLGLDMSDLPTIGTPTPEMQTAIDESIGRKLSIVKQMEMVDALQQGEQKDLLQTAMQILAGGKITELIEKLPPARRAEIENMIVDSSKSLNEEYDKLKKIIQIDDEILHRRTTI